ncbi:thioredoxin family protein [Seonamhaeicola aphaedonensis]|uniref:Thioredoxin-like protein n=1 Tax=Seonamhaeicola aphaedonensis TaxID=1461338 RepID=A0A3D9H3S7_9FLAO|nr:thioredoxin family protein [Seonamhaeicola aphaedonensis]RED44158.1 thioredoxin-like protein [Seonamhaeicola aphaedonensis]
MIKKVIVTVIVISIYSVSFSQILIKNPKNGSSNYLGDLVKIELKDSLSIFHFDKKTNDSIAYKLNNNFFIQTEIDTSKFFLLRVKNIKHKPNKENGYTYVIDFPAINRQAKIINIMYEEDSKGSWKAQSKNYATLLSDVEIKQINKSELEQKTFSKNSFKRTLLDAKEQNKNILLYFTAGWCYPCKWMDKYIFSHEEVHDNIISDFITLKVDVDSQKGEKLRQIYSGEGIPNFFILNSDGGILKKRVGSMKKSEFLDFLLVDNFTQPRKPKIKTKKTITKDIGIGLRLGLTNNNINNLSNTKSRTGITIDALYSIDYNRRYLIRTGLGFSSKGTDGLAVNYLKIPLEFGYSIYKGSLFDLPGAIRLIGAPYYAIRLNKDGLGISNNDYGVRFGISPQIGDFTELEFEIYYEYGMNDLFESISGKQNNRSFGLSLSLTL